MMRRSMALGLGLMLIAATAAAQETVVRVFRLQSLSVPEATALVQPELSAAGTLTVTPRERTLTVQDRPDVIARVAKILGDEDAVPMSYTIALQLVAASDGSLPAGMRSIAVDERVRQMFRYRAYWELGRTTIQGQVGLATTVQLNDSFQVVLRPQTGLRRRSAPARPAPTEVQGEGSQPWGARVEVERTARQVRALALLTELLLIDRRAPDAPLLRTNISIGPNQTVVLGATRSEDSGRALILIVEARPE